MAATTAGVWGIDLGQCALKAIRLELIEGQVTATAFDYIEHPKILSQPDADPDALTREALEQFLSRNTLRGDTVVIGVPGQSGLARFVKLPPVDEKKIVDIVRFEAKQQIPFPLEEVVWDYQKIGSGDVIDGLALETEIGLFAMKRDMINRSMQHFKDVNVEVHVVQMAPLALCNYLTYDLLGQDANQAPEEGAEEKQCIVALDIGADSSNLVITDGAKVIWQRPIPTGGNAFTRALTKDLKLTFAKAEHVKRNAVKSPDLKKILTALRPVLNEFVNEVQRSLGYFTNTHRSATIQYMVGLGNAFRLPGLQKFLQEKLSLEVRKLTHFERLQGDEVQTAPQFTENILSFAVAHGLALQGLEVGRVQTNLLPQEIRTERLVRAKKPWAAAVAAALLLAVAGLTFGSSVRYASYNNPKVNEAISRGKNVVQNAQTIVSNYNTEEGKATAARQAVNLIASGVEERYNWNLIYKYINDLVPQPNANAPRLAERARDGGSPARAYRTEEAVVAWNKYVARRQANPNKIPNPEQERKDEQFIKKHLIQVNIESVECLYSDDLGPFFKNLTDNKHLLRGMSSAEKANVQGDAKDKLPKSGWVFEIRGYTYHDKEDDFVLNSFVENLANPETPGVLDKSTYPGSKLPPDMKKIVKDRLEYVFLHDFWKVYNPEPGTLVYIQNSYLPQALAPAQAAGGGFGTQGSAGKSPDAAGGDPNSSSAPAGPSRDAWVPVGEIAQASLGRSGGQSFGGRTTGRPPETGVRPATGVPGGNQPSTPETGTALTRPRRTEFVVMFIWREPLPTEAQPGQADPGASPGATPASTTPPIMMP